jgi:asparagine synthetase A
MSTASVQVAQKKDQYQGVPRVQINTVAAPNLCPRLPSLLHTRREKLADSSKGCIYLLVHGVEKMSSAAHVMRNLQLDWALTRQLESTQETRPPRLRLD